MYFSKCISQKILSLLQVLFIAATLALASAGLAPTCDECNAAAAGLLVKKIFLEILHFYILTFTSFSTS